MYVFPSWDELLRWARKVAFDFDFVIVILISDTSNFQRGRKTYLLLDCKRRGKYKRYKKDLQVIESGSRKCDCPFKLQGKLLKCGEE